VNLRVHVAHASDVQVTLPGWGTLVDLLDGDPLVDDDQSPGALVFTDACSGEVWVVGGTPEQLREFADQVAVAAPGDTTVDELFQVADDREADMLDSLRERAGQVWVCTAKRGPDHECRWRNLTSWDTCDGCGAPRPTEEAT